METQKHQFSTRVGTSLRDPAAPSPAALVMKPLSVSDRWEGGTRGGHRGAIGGAWPDSDSATRCHGTTWGISYIPYTCVTCRLLVCLHAMEIERRRFAARVRRVRAGRHSHDGRSRRDGADARGWLRVTHPRGTQEGAEARRLDGSPGRADHGRARRDVAARHASRIARALAAGKTVSGIGGADEPCGMHARTHCPARWREPVEDTGAAR